MQTTVQTIHKGFSNGVIPMPYTIARYACGHGVEMKYRDERSNCHSPENWLIQSGAVVDCFKCDQNREAVQRIIAFAQTPEYSHTTLRDLTASKTGEWMAFCTYRVDRTSPTQCRLEMSVEATPETERALVEAGIRFVPGPSRGSMARL
jgi:hypothetical protein